MSPARTPRPQTILGAAVGAVLLAQLVAATTPLAAATFTGSPRDLERIATTLRERGAVEIEVPGALALSGEWTLPEGTITIRAGGGIIADGWRLSSPGSTLTLEGPGVRLRGRTQVTVARTGGAGGSVALRGGGGIVEVGPGASIDASGAVGQGGHILLSANDVRARGALSALGRGSIEVEARASLLFVSHADTGGGLVRLDPTNMVIGNFGPTNPGVTIVYGTPGVTPDEVTPNIAPGTGQLDAVFLAGMLANNSVVVHTTPAAGPFGGLQSGITGDTTDGDISVETAVEWTSAFDLTLLAHDDLIVRAHVQNKLDGDVVGVSGWDGATMAGFTGNAVPAGAYGAVGGDTFIFGAARPSPADNGVAFGSRAGTTALWSYDLRLKGSTVATAPPGTLGVNGDGFAMAGFRLSDGSTASGPIQVTAHHDVSLVGGTTEQESDRFAQIGHGGVLRKVGATLYTPGNTQGALSGAITVRVDGALLLDDGINYGYAQIGHGGLMFQGQRGTITGDINVSAAAVTILADFFVSGRPASYAMIGHGGNVLGGFSEEGVAGDIDGAITVACNGRVSPALAGNLTLTTSSRNSGGAKIGHGGSGNWSDDGGSQIGSIGSHVAGGAPITVTAAGNVTLNHDLVGGGDGTSQIGHGGAIFYAGNVGTILGNITVTTATGNVSLTGGGNCLGSCGTQIGHGSLLESLFNVDAGALRGDITVTAGGAVTVVGGGVTNGGPQYEWTQIGHGGPLLGFQQFNGGVAGRHLIWAGVPAAGADTNDVTLTGASVLVQGGKGASAAAQIGNGGFIYQFNNFGTMSVGPLDGKVTVTATTGDLQVLAGTDAGGNDVAFGTAAAQIGNGGQNFSPAGVTTVTESGASGAVEMTVAQETSLTNDAAGSMWWLGHRTRGALTAAPVRLDTGTLDFLAGHTGGTTATINDPTFWSRFVTPPSLPALDKANAQGGIVTLRVHGTTGANGDLISALPLTIPGTITNAVHVLSTDDLTLNSPVTNNSAPPVDVDFVADDANPSPAPPPGWSVSAFLNLGVGGAPVGPVRLFAVAPAQFSNLSGYVPPAQQFGVWYQVAGAPVVGANFKAVVTPVELLEFEVE